MIGFGMIAMVFLPLLGVLGLSLVLRSAWVPAMAKQGASCGACGYEVIAFGPRCSECGSLLTKVGVVTPRAILAHRGSTMLLIAGWSLFFPIIGLPLGWLGMTIAGVFAPAAATPLLAGGIGWQWDWIYNLRIEPRADYTAPDGAGTTRRKVPYEIRIAINTNDDPFRKPVEGIAEITGVYQGKTAWVLAASHPGGAFTVTNAKGVEILAGTGMTAALGPKLFEALIPPGERIPEDDQAATDLGIVLEHLFEQEPLGLLNVFNGRGGSGKLQVARGNDNQFQAVPDASGNLPMTLKPVPLAPAAAAGVPKAPTGAATVETLATWVPPAVAYLVGLTWLVRRRARIMRLA